MYDVEIQDTCFKGTVEEANRLLAHILDINLLNYDYLSFQNNRILDENTVSVDVANKEEDSSYSTVIKSCN